ncbi:MAG: hypothetical protein R3C44_15005 [Chloroflexota bacterium]
MGELHETVLGTLPYGCFDSCCRRGDLYFSVRDQFAGRNVEAVTGVVGSEKIPFFSDERVQEAFRRNGLDVQVQKAGSREIATSYDLSEYDFAFPAGVPAAEKLQRENGISKSYNVFFTPMAIASWRTIGDVLVDNGIATDEGGYYIVDMDALLQLMSEEKRWEDLLIMMHSQSAVASWSTQPMSAPRTRRPCIWH